MGSRMYIVRRCIAAMLCLCAVACKNPQTGSSRDSVMGIWQITGATVDDSTIPPPESGWPVYYRFAGDSFISYSTLGDCVVRGEAVSCLYDNDCAVVSGGSSHYRLCYRVSGDNAVFHYVEIDSREQDSSDPVTIRAERVGVQNVGVQNFEPLPRICFEGLEGIPPEDNKYWFIGRWISIQPRDSIIMSFDRQVIMVEWIVDRGSRHEYRCIDYDIADTLVRTCSEEIAVEYEPGTRLAGDTFVLQGWTIFGEYSPPVAGRIFTRE